MNMVLDATDEERGAFPLYENSCLISEQAIPMFLRNQRRAMFCAIHEMDQVFDERLGHGICVWIVSPFQGSSSF